MSTRLDRCAPTATKTASNPPSRRSASRSSTRWPPVIAHAERRDPLELGARAPPGAAGRPGCRSASSRRARLPRRGSRPRGPAGPGGRRPTARSARRRSPAPACRCGRGGGGEQPTPAPGRGRRGSARPSGSRPRCRARRGCTRSRRGGSRPARGSAGNGLSATRARQASLVTAGLDVGEPGLDVLAGRAADVARRQQVHVDGASAAHRPGPSVLFRQLGQPRDVLAGSTHRSSHPWGPSLWKVGHAARGRLRPRRGARSSVRGPHRLRSRRECPGPRPRPSRRARRRRRRRRRR